MPRLELFFLGSPHIAINGKTIEIGRRKSIALLAYLAISGEAHRRDHLGALFWPDLDQSRASAYLRQALWEINRSLGETWIKADRETVSLAAQADIWNDVRAFHQELATAAKHTHSDGETCAACVQALQQAIDLYRGDFLEGFGLRDSPEFDDWQFFQADALRRDLCGALQKLVRLLQAAGEAGTAVAYARRWLSLDRLDEEAHRQLMWLYALNGERNAALRQYQECARILNEELKVLPDEQTEALHQQIQHDTLEMPVIAAASVPSQPPTAAPSTVEELLCAAMCPMNNLPVQSTPFIGRRTELDELTNLLQNPACRVITLLGPGGIGKTRLALQAAEENQALFPHGVVLVALAPLDTPQSIIPAVANALGMTYRYQDAQLKEQLFAHLYMKQLLLVMDNFEHLVQGADILAEISAQAAGVKILTTSRQRLNLSGEWVMEISGMHFPGASPSIEEVVFEEVQPLEVSRALERYSAVQLFLQSARRVRGDFVITPEAYPAVVRIAQLVEGMPLGLELAAPWVSVLSCDEIATEIERNLDFLESASQDVPERQHSIRAVFDHSWKLLNEQERRLFPRFVVFQNGFTRQAVQEITGASMHDLMSLVNKSLLRRSEDGRFGIHELLHQYAAEKLAQEPELHDEIAERHTRYYCRAMYNWGEALQGSQQRLAQTELQVDLENVLAAWRWAASHKQVDLLEQACEGLGKYYLRQRRYEEGLNIYRFAATQLSEHSAMTDINGLDGQCHLAYLLLWQSTFMSFSGQGKEASKINEQVANFLTDSQLDVQQERRLRAFYLYVQGLQLFYDQGDIRGASMLEESLVLHQQIGDLWRASELLSTLGWVAKWQRDHERANQMWTEAIQIKKQLGDRLGLAVALLEQGQQVAFGIGDLQTAERLFRESNQILAELGDQASFARILENMDHVYIANGRFAEALDVRLHKLAYFKTIGSRYTLGMAYAHLCEVYHMLGDYQQSIIEGRAALEVLSGIDENFEHAFACWELGLTLLATGKLDEAEELFRRSETINRKAHRPDGIGNTLAALARLSIERGDYDLAWQQVLKGLAWLLKYKNFFWMLYGLADVALILAQRGEIERAVTIYTVVSQQPFVANSHWFADIYGQHIQSATVGLSPDKLAQAQARGQQMTPWKTVVELVDEFRVE